MGGLERVRRCAEELTRRQDEALATLRDETAILECFFLEQAEDGDYLIGVMCAENFEQSRAAVESSLHSIDAYHQHFKKTPGNLGHAWSCSWNSTGSLNCAEQLR